MSPISIGCAPHHVARYCVAFELEYLEGQLGWELDRTEWVRYQLELQANAM